MKTPILVLNPNDDLVRFTPRIAPYLKNGRVVDLPQWGHGFFDLHTAEAAQIIRPFLDEDKWPESAGAPAGILIGRGRIAYLSDKPEDRGRSRGFEMFTITRDDDGAVMHRALCAITDPPHVQRDITQHANKDLRPSDCYVRIRVGAAPPFKTGSGWFLFGPEVAECEAETSVEGRVSQRHRLTDGPVVFCNHSIVGDAWMMAAYPLAQGPGEFLVRNMLLPTLNKQGATGLMLAHAHEAFKFFGRERITVRAGAFDCLHFKAGSVPLGIGSSSARAKVRLRHVVHRRRLPTPPVLTGYLGERRYELRNSLGGDEAT